jgi:hypothetical protein
MVSFRSVRIREQLPAARTGHPIDDEIVIGEHQ